MAWPTMALRDLWFGPANLRSGIYRGCPLSVQPDLGGSRPHTETDRELSPSAVLHTGCVRRQSLRKGVRNLPEQRKDRSSAPMEYRGFQ